MAAARAPNFRPRRSDDLGLRQALSDRLLPLLVAAMVFLAALAAAGAIAAADLARHWRGGAAMLMTVQVPQPDEAAASGAQPRAAAVAAILSAQPHASVTRLGAQDVGALLRPWLGDDAASLSVALPAVFELRGAGPETADGLAAAVAKVAPGTLLERNAVWFDRLAVLAGSLQASAALALIVVTFVAVAVIAVATRAGLGLRRDAIEIVHGLGATDGMIAGRFAGRITLLAFTGGILGVVLVVPLLLGLASLTAPFQPPEMAVSGSDRDLPSVLLAALPAPLWAVMPALPLIAAAIGWLTTQATVRRWLARLP